MNQSNLAVFIFLIIMFANSADAQSFDTVEELKVCARMTDQEARLDCYDNLGQRVLGEESTDNEPTQEKVAQPESETATTTIVQPLPDDLNSSKTIEYVGSVTSCKKGVYGNWYFIFDNGQVWKEVNSRNRRFKECSFNVTITRDRFGYKMRVDGEEETIRVKRNR